jgi:hypothetical protein
MMGPDPEGQILNFPSSTHNAEGSPVPRSSSRDAECVSVSIDSLSEVDHIFEMRSRRIDGSAQRQSDQSAERTRLRAEFSTACREQILPAMRGFLERLRMNGGGGLLEEREGVQEAGVAPRVRLWMSLAGELIGRPRQDQHPYLQLDYDADQQQVNVAEGDMWKGHGTSGPVGTWIAREITNSMVTESLIGVLRRAAVQVP